MQSAPTPSVSGRWPFIATLCLVTLVALLLLSPARSFALDGGDGSAIATVVATGEGDVAITCDGGRLNVSGAASSGETRCAAIDQISVALGPGTHALRISYSGRAAIRVSTAATIDDRVAIEADVRTSGAFSADGGSVRLAGNISAASIVANAIDTIVVGGGAHAGVAEGMRLTAGAVVVIEDGAVLSAPGGGVTVEATNTPSAVSIGGDIDTSNPGGRGGTIVATADTLIAGGDGSAPRLDASGRDGGGTVLLGGGLRGTGPVRHATSTGLGQDVTVAADATGTGNGGTIVAWSDETTVSAAVMSARGGPGGGDGGSIEISSKREVSAIGATDVSAPAGADGIVALDPLFFWIVPTGVLSPITGIHDANALFFSSAVNALKYIGCQVFDMTCPDSALGGMLVLYGSTNLTLGLLGKLHPAFKAMAFSIGLVNALGTKTVELFTGNIDVSSLFGIHLLHGLQALTDINLGLDDGSLDLTNQDETESVKFQTFFGLIDFGPITSSNADLKFRAGDTFSPDDIVSIILGILPGGAGIESLADLRSQITDINFLDVLTAAIAAAIINPVDGGLDDILDVVNVFCGGTYDPTADGGKGDVTGGCVPDFVDDLVTFLSDPASNFDKLDDILEGLGVATPSWLDTVFDVLDAIGDILDTFSPPSLIDAILGGIDVCVGVEDDDLGCVGIPIDIPGVCDIDDSIPCSFNALLSQIVAPLIVDAIGGIIDFTGLGNYIGQLDDWDGYVPDFAAPNVLPAMMYFDSVVTALNSKVEFENPSEGGAIVFNNAIKGDEVIISVPNGKVDSRSLSFADASSPGVIGLSDKTVGAGAIWTANAMITAAGGIGTSASPLCLAPKSGEAGTIEPVITNTEMNGIYLCFIADVTLGEDAHISGPGGNTLSLDGPGDVTLSGLFEDKPDGNIVVTASEDITLTSTGTLDADDGGTVTFNVGDANNAGGTLNPFLGVITAASIYENGGPGPDLFDDVTPFATMPITVDGKGSDDGIDNDTMHFDDLGLETTQTTDRKIKTPGYADVTHAELEVITGVDPTITTIHSTVDGCTDIPACRSGLVMNEGETFTGKFNWIDWGASNFTLDIDWGDGSPGQLQSIPLTRPDEDQAILTGDLSHFFVDDSLAGIPMRITDDQDDGEDSDTLGLVVNNVPPSPFADDIIMDVRETFTLLGTWTDPGTTYDQPYTWSWSVDQPTFDNGGKPVKGTTGSSQYLDTVPFSSSISAPGVYHFTFTVTDNDGGTTSYTATVIVRNRWVVWAEGGFLIEREAQILSGDLGSPNPSLVGSTVRNKLGFGTGVYADNLVIRGGATVSLAFANRIQNLGTLKVSVVPIPGKIITPRTPIPNPRPGTRDVIIGGTEAQCAQKNVICPGQNGLLPPGRYNALISHPNGIPAPTIVMAGGTYHFSRIDIGEAARVEFGLGATVHVKAGMRLGVDTFVGPRAGSRVAAHDIVFLVAGPMIGSANAVDINTGARLEANVFAPTGTFHWSSGSSGKGAYIGDYFIINLGVKLQLDSAFALP